MPSSRAYLSVGILCVINLINYMDRLTVAGVLIEIKKYYGLTNATSGLLQTCFIVSFLAMAPLFGYLGDRYKRKYVIVAGIAFWSTTTLLGSFVPSDYPVLFFILRSLVGVGEASYTTIAPTIIADLFKRNLRSKMLAVFYFAIPCGSGLGYLVGSTVSKMFGSWQWAFRVTPPIGFILAIIVCLFIKEPERGESDGINREQLEKSKFKTDIYYLIKVRSYVWSTVGFTCCVFTVGALAWWAPTYMEYAFHYSGDTTGIDMIGLIFGGITCLAGVVGVCIGSGAAQYFRRKYPRVDPVVCAFGILMSLPFIYAGLYIAHLKNIRFLAWFLLFVAEVFLCTNWAVVTDMLLYIVSANRRAIAQAVQISVTHLLGDAISPYIVGLISDGFLREQTSHEAKYYSLQYAMFIMTLLLIPGGIAFWYSSLFIIHDEAAAKEIDNKEAKLTCDASDVIVMSANNKVKSKINSCNDSTNF